jgi:energy-coupling factor transporter ATP-binding protein EcfA2
MPTAKIRVSSPVRQTPRVLQACGLFDVPPTAASALEWDVNLPLEDRGWHLGLIVGPSGCGKSTIARALWPRHLAPSFAWPAEQSLLDGFPPHLSIKDITALLSSVGFSSPPAWLRPFHVLSTGQQFRVTMARLLAERPGLAVVDEYTSVVDRTVAQVGSHAVARTVRSRGQQLVAVTCHEDVEPWLNPDWVYRPAENRFTWRLLQRRPAIRLRARRVRSSAWELFRQHHYLATSLAAGAQCWAAFWDGRPVAFSAWVHSLSNFTGKREHRTVVLPDYQGVGIGHALSTHLAAMWKALGYRAGSTTTHPAFLAARMKDPRWRLIRAPSLCSRGRLAGLKHACTRLTAGFEYVGPPLDRTLALALRG